MPEVQTLDEAFAKARDAQRRGLQTVALIVDGMRTPRAHRVYPFRGHWGCVGFVVRRLTDEDGVITHLEVRVDVVDVLEAARERIERDAVPPRPVKTGRRRLKVSTSR